MSRGPKWTEAEHLRLRHMREVEQRIWADISLPGRSSKACEIEYHRAGFIRLSPVEPKPVPPRERTRRSAQPQPAHELPDPAIERAIPRARRSDLGALRDKAELRDRIIERGLTGGVFGDPPPGRSALDERRAAAASPTFASSHCEVTSSPRDGRDQPGYLRFPTSPQVTT